MDQAYEQPEADGAGDAQNHDEEEQPPEVEADADHVYQENEEAA